MKSFLTAICLALTVLGSSGTAFAKDNNSTGLTKSAQVNKAKALVNINKADANALVYYLKGIGEVKAAAIIQYRKENGPFKSTDDLLKVSGIGDATFNGLKKNVSTTRGEVSAPIAAKGDKKSGTTKSTAKKVSTSPKKQTREDDVSKESGNKLKSQSDEGDTKSSKTTSKAAASASADTKKSAAKENDKVTAKKERACKGSKSDKDCTPVKKKSAKKSKPSSKNSSNKKSSSKSKERKSKASKEESKK
ncbi:MAG: hypothetical protein CSB47_03050 [Proteobacteria bacterium]|nr:MAG: hypothetical protein CSB47_03050 [Pseudomonadota bacterium]